MPRRPVIKPYVWPLPAFKHTVAALKACRELAATSRPLSLITAAAGEGKTFPAEWFVANNKSVRHAFCPPKDVLTTRSLLERIYEACGHIPTARTNYGLLQHLADCLASAKVFLLVDEADRLRPGAVDVLRELAEYAGIAICLLGCPGVMATLEYVPAARHRIGFWFQVPAVQEADLQHVLRDQYDEPTVAEIYEQTHGNLRHVEALLETLSLTRNTAGVTVIDATAVQVAAVTCLLGAA